MPIINVETWKSWVKANDDDYGKACVDTARQAMVILDEGPSDFDCHSLVCRAADEALGKDAGITGFMSGMVAVMISKCHSRGEEFRHKWNIDTQIRDEGERANEAGTVLNPALLTIDLPDTEERRAD